MEIRTASKNVDIAPHITLDILGDAGGGVGTLLISTSMRGLGGGIHI